MIIKNIKEIDEVLKLKKVFIFDFDGTIADTEPISWKAHNMCLKEFNIVLGDEEIKRYIGNTDEKIYSMIMEDYGIQVDKEAIINKKISLHLELAKAEKVKPFKFFTDICSMYPDISYNILSSNKVSVIEEALQDWGLLEKFDKIISVSTGEVSKKEVYKDTYKFYGYSNEDAVLFEDSNKYLGLGKDEGIYTVGVNSRYKYEALTDCDVIVDVL